jgi:tetratricopeptide (TPR) repeat protein
MSVEMPAFEHDYYEILQVHPKATLAVIKKAYRTLLLEMGNHPDQGGDTETAALITEAYKVLSNPDRRAEYDRYYLARMGLGPQPHAAPKEAKAKSAPKEAPKQQARPAAASAAAGTETPETALIVLCPKCRTKNRVRNQELLALAKCSRCGQHLNKLPNPLADLKEHVLAAVGDRIGRAALPRWIKLGIPIVMILASGLAIAYTFQDALIPIGDPIEKADQLRKEKKYDQAAHLLQKAVDREPENPRLHEKLGDVYTKQKMHELALAHYNQAIWLNSSNSYLYTLRGNSLIQLGKVEDAEENFKQALRLDPQQGPALVALGNVYAKQQRFKDAAALYRQALNGQMNADVLYNLGLVYEWEGRKGEAIASYKNALIQDPNHRSSMVSLASLYYEQRKWEMAAAQLIKASHLKHSDVDLHLKLADIYERTGRTQEAIKEWQVCLEQGKDSPIIVAKAKRALQKLGVTVG